MTSPRLGVVILGAGASSRMGRPKLLLPWRGTTVIGHIIRQWRELGAFQVTVVGRPRDSALDAELDRVNFPAANRIFNPQAEQGMFSSIQAAGRWTGWEAEISSWAIVLGDQPHLRADTLGQLLEFHAQNPQSICQPAFEGRGRHPVILPGAAFERLKESDARDFSIYLKEFSQPAVKCVINDPGLTLDMDVPGDYKRLINLEASE
ncbi:MAG: nucleotidyltransferase family protein [Verrucomicrobia bacterium]|nr:nucleotidyltransferase family protein [Verrucomicrobiota bacterium]MDE3100000.1 nucleotidyltransferase family protein [Verrucomicrobiota bacterium]